MRYVRKPSGFHPRPILTEIEHNVINRCNTFIVTIMLENIYLSSMRDTHSPTTQPAITHTKYIKPSRNTINDNVVRFFPNAMRAAIALSYVEDQVVTITMTSAAMSESRLTMVTARGLATG